MKTFSGMSKFIAFVGGVALACLLCGAPLFYLMWTGRFQQFAQPFAYAAQTSVVMPVASETPTPTVVIAETPTPDPAELPFLERFELAGPYISEALEYSRQGSYTESILAWDKALEIIPDWAEGYYNRGQAYLNLLGNQRSQQEFMHYLSLAGADFDQAIALEPYKKGDYYLGRYKYYDHLAGLQINRVDNLQLEQIALDNLLIANRLGNFDPLAERYLLFSNIIVGNCDAGIEQASHLIETATEPSAALQTGLSLGYFCKNDLDKALQYIDKAIQIKDTCERRLERARILYVMGRNEEAITELDDTISSDPYYCGERYYLRGLLHAEMGNLEAAQEDLYFGMGQTWGRGGLLSYGLGKIALAQGDTETAIQYFQEAEVTYRKVDPLLIKMQADLAALGAAPLPVTVSVSAVTAIPTPSPRPTVRPTSTPDPALPTPLFTMDPNLQYAMVVDMEKTVGPIPIAENYYGLWRFQAAESLDHSDVQQLSVWVQGSDTTQRLPRQLLLWNFRTNMWGGVEELKWGENRLGLPDEYVSQDGDVIVQLSHQGDNLSTTIDSLGITLVLQRTNGSIEVHGITP